MASKPKFKKRCMKCKTFKFIKPNWNQCMNCWEKNNGKYSGTDRHLYVG